MSTFLRIWEINSSVEMNLTNIIQIQSSSGLLTNDMTPLICFPCFYALGLVTNCNHKKINSQNYREEKYEIRINSFLWRTNQRKIPDMKDYVLKRNWRQTIHNSVILRPDLESFTNFINYVQQHSTLFGRKIIWKLSKIKWDEQILNV